MSFDVKIDLSGPVADGLAPGIMYRYARHVETVLGDRAVTDIRAYLPTQYMYLGHNGGDPFHNPVPGNAGALQASIHSERARPEEVLVTDDPATYGAWIEGVDALNAVHWPGRVRRGLSPRFPGYHAFRKIAQQLRAEAPSIAEGELPPFILEMNS